MEEPWDGSSFHAAIKMGLPRSFSQFHGRLLDLCLEAQGGRTSRSTSGDRVVPTLEQDGRILTHRDLKSLTTMVELEFLASMKQELEGSESSDKAEPHVFDIFLMKVTLAQDLASGHRGRSARPIAICVPYRKKLVWWNGLPREFGGEFWSLDTPCSHVRKISSLSGSARVLQALSDARGIAANELLVQAAMRRSPIFSLDADDSSKDLPFYDSSEYGPMNRSQHQAVNALSVFRQGFFCIQGPPGCGKTTTMVNMILAALKKESVIVAAPSNAAVANIALKLFATGRVPFGRMVVFGENCDESVRFLQPKFRSVKYSQFREKYDDLLCSKDGKEPSTRQKEMANKLLWEFAIWLKLDVDESDLSLKDIVKQCPSLPLDEHGSLSSSGRLILNQILANADVVFCTLNSAGSFSLRSALKGENFHTLMLDEGGQCTEAEFFIATTFQGVKRIVVMGDPQQLRPTVIDPTCAQAGFGNSFLGQAYKSAPESLHLLDTQYRMDPAISRFPNKRFYGNRIQNGGNVYEREPCVENPFLFVDTDRRGQEMKVGFSWQNQYEASVISIMFRSDKDIKRLLVEGIEGETKVIVITPYKSQMKLLQEQIKLPKGSKARLMISTVDAFQGQEGDIVIVSTVRTKRVGFVDDSQRLNVALTRAKRVLRVVGEMNFFENLNKGSTLRALAAHAKNENLLQRSKIARLRHCPPDWSMPTAWALTMTARFYDCLLKMKDERKKNFCLNTLFALATPDLGSVKGGKVTETTSWKINNLKELTGNELCIVWVAKGNKHDSKPILEAHFAGTRNEALQFRQKHLQVPNGSRAPNSDMSGLLPLDEASAPEGGIFAPSWRLGNGIQQAILYGDIADMPLSLLELDGPQKLAAQADAPLMIESRSGTGKTLVLLQHAALMTRRDKHRPACFVTVSPKLKDELKKKYEELRPVLFAGLLPTEFFSFRQLLERLCEAFHIHDFKSRDICTLGGYYNAKNSFQRSVVEPQLVQNEIGGVIMGSLEAAKGRRSLTRNEYLLNKRSNISIRTSGGQEQRNLVYDEYESYVAWKAENGKCDLSDIVLRILKENLYQCFSSAYLDEVQDLSHSAIYLICHLAGKDCLHWVCAGDPAQMISPGCSFTFDGLKQTLLSVAPGIESKLKEVHHLVINYRTTKDILVMANAILDRAKQAFPGAIEYALPETAVKDLGLRVVTCSWKDAMQTSVKFGQNQVYIYSPSDSDVLPEEARQWLNGHPFILSSLDSKGLEFDDVVVAFDMERKIWDISRQLEASLRLLRELYVAVTRAQRRVVILMKSGNDNMKQFFHDLGCEEMSAESILQEFNHETTTQQWYERGLELFESERFKIAANCFTRAEHPGWAFLANGKQSLSIGNDREAENCFRKAVQLFHERQEYDKVLDLLKEVLFICTDWDPSLDSAFETAFSKVPKHLPRNYAIEFNLKRDRWNLIRLQDLSDPSLSDIFSRYRGNAGLNEMVQSATDEQRLDIESLLPWAHADFHVALGNHMQALKIFLTHGEIKNAETCSERLLHVGRWRKTPENCQVLVALWKAKTFARTRIGPKNKLSLLLQLFMQPEKVAFDSGSDCIRDFGRDVIRCAFDEANIEYTALLSFKDATFNSEVTFKLQERFHPYYSHVVEWLVDSGHGVLASDYARKNDWSNDDLFRLALAFRSRPKWLLQTLQQRKLLNATSQMILCSARLSEENKKQYRSDYESSFSRPIPDELERFDFLAVFTAELERFDFLAVFTASGPVLELKKSGMWVELAFIYGYLGFYHVAMVKSVQALQSESKNVSKVLRLWEEFGRPRNDLDPTIVRQRILIKLLDTMNTKVTYGHDGDIVTCDMERLAFSLEPFHEVYSDSEEEIDYWRLVQKFDPTVAAYSRLCFGAHDESLLESLAEHYTALTALLSNRRCSVGDGAHACAPKLTKQPSRSMPTGPTTNQNQPKNKGGENKKKRRNRKKKRK